AAVSRALAKNPRDRFPSMDAFAAELEACLAELRAGAGDSTAATVVRPSDSQPTPSRRRRRRLAPGPLLMSLLALAALAVIVVAAIAVERNDSVLPGISSAKGGGGRPVALSGVSGFDPNGDGAEHDADAAKATDGDATTYWETEHYANEDFGGL